MRFYYIICLAIAIWVILPSISLAMNRKENRTVVCIETTEGVIRVALYNETPLHRDNFLRVVRSGYYDGLLFHRVIKDFMIQTGDEASRNAQANEYIGDSLAVDTIHVVPAEIRLPLLYHKRGALAAAREPDAVNPNRNSSDTQFYIVWGRTFSERQIMKMRGIVEENTGGVETMTSQMSQAYQQYGGTPHLDGAYTVFGEVVEGLKVVNAIQRVQTDINDRPVEDVRIIRAYVEE